MIGKNGLDLIKEFEGFRNKAYQDSGGVWTIGWGTTKINGVNVKSNDICTASEAELYLQIDAHQSEKLVDENVKVPLTQNQFDAMVSIIYNVGPGKPGIKSGIIKLKNGTPSTLLRLLNLGDYSGSADHFLDWFRTAGSESGLLRRRRAERKLFLTPDI